MSLPVNWERYWNSRCIVPSSERMAQPPAAQFQFFDAPLRKTKRVETVSEREREKRPLQIDQGVRNARRSVESGKKSIGHGLSFVQIQLKHSSDGRTTFFVSRYFIVRQGVDGEKSSDQTNVDLKGGHFTALE